MPDPPIYDLDAYDEERPLIDRRAHDVDPKRVLTLHDAHVLHCACTVEVFDPHCARLRAALQVPWLR